MKSHKPWYDQKYLYLKQYILEAKRRQNLFLMFALSPLYVLLNPRQLIIFLFIFKSSEWVKWPQDCCILPPPLASPLTTTKSTLSGVARKQGDSISGSQRHLRPKGAFPHTLEIATTVPMGLLRPVTSQSVAQIQAMWDCPGFPGKG